MKTKEEIIHLAQEFHYEFQNQGLNADGCFNQYQGFIKGYTQCQENMVDKKYTEEDLRKAFKYGIEIEAGIESFDYKNYPDGFSQFIDSLNKQD